MNVEDVLYFPLRFRNVLYFTLRFWINRLKSTDSNRQLYLLYIYYTSFLQVFHDEREAWDTPRYNRIDCPGERLIHLEARIGVRRWSLLYIFPSGVVIAPAGARYRAHHASRWKGERTAVRSDAVVKKRHG